MRPSQSQHEFLDPARAAKAAELQAQLDDPSLSSAKKYAVKKQLAMVKAEDKRERRKLEQLQRQQD